MRRTALKRRKRPREHQEDRRRWHGEGAKRCEAPECDGSDRRIDRHHCVYKKKVELVGGDVWDPANAFDICRVCHDAHHGRSRPIPLTALPDSAIEFAFELLGPHAYDYLLRRYEGEDERLEFALVQAERDILTEGPSGCKLPSDTDASVPDDGEEP